MTPPVGLPRAQIVDSRGVPVRGAKVAYYDADTGIRKPAYKDADFTEHHSWPIVADSAGRFPVTYLTPGAYKIVVEDATGRAVYSDPRIVVGTETHATDASRLGLPVIQSFQSSYLTADDANTLQDVTADSYAVTKLLPNAEDVGNGVIIAVRKSGGDSAVVVKASDGSKINGVSELRLTEQYQYVMLISDGGVWLGLTINQAVQVGFHPVDGFESTNVQSAILELAAKYTGTLTPVQAALDQMKARVEVLEQAAIASGSTGGPPQLQSS